MLDRFIRPLESRRHFAVSVPSGFTVSDFTTGLAQPTAMVFAPDGRLFVAEKEGNVRVVKDGALQSTPFVSLSVNSEGERGVIGIALDPGFASNNFVYVYYTTSDGTIHNRLSRFTASGDVAAGGSEAVLADLPELGATNHNGGALAFGPDGKLYVGIGENGVGDRSPEIDTVFGKVLRINPDGTIPADGPFFSQTTGLSQAIYAKGLRNPYTIAFSPTGQLLINDVGAGGFEEINLGVAGADYGWPGTEGVTSAPGITSPIYSYPHRTGAAIIGGAFLADGGYYFGDLNQGFIRRLDVASIGSGDTVTDFASEVDSAVDFDRGPDGSLYVLSISTGSVMRIAGPFSQTPVGPTVTTKVPKGNYVAGKPQAFSFAARDGTKNAAPTAFSYRFDLVSPTLGTTNLVPLTTGKKAAKAVVPSTIVGTDFLLRLTLTVTGASGTSTTVTRDVNPSVRTIPLRTNLEGIAVTPASITAVAGTTASASASQFPEIGATNYVFKKWSGAGKGTNPELSFIVPDKDIPAIATYAAVKSRVR